MRLDKLLTTSSIMAVGFMMLAAPAQVHAQSSDEATNDTDSIVVTGSRITMSGYQQPTPVTVVGEDIINRDAKMSIGDTIRELPQVGSSASPNNGVGGGGIVAGTAGLDTVNLRQLGSNRTLVLFDGQRVIQSVVTGEVDLGTLPSMLVQRIDIVTAGASAAWGSDAVAGVTNLILNKKFDGLKINADYGNSDAWDHKNYRAQAAFGTDFAGGRGHVIVAGTFVNSPEPIFAKQRSWDTHTQLFNNPAYTPGNDEPRYIHVDHAGLAQATTGGLITGGPLKGIQFVGPNATPVLFTPGITTGPLTANGSQEELNPTLNNLTTAYKSRTAFGYVSYELTDSIKASIQANYGKTHSINNSTPFTVFGSFNIPIDNAFLPQSVKDLMTQNGVTSVPVGTTNLNNLQLTDKYSYDLFQHVVGVPVGVIDRTLKRFVFSLEGDLGSDWKWNAYAQIGRTHMYQTTLSNIIPANLNRAIDAVSAPAGNLLGVPAGTIVCRSSLTDPTNGCVPLNIFGTGVASEAAIRYVNVKPGQNYQDQKFQQDVYAATLQGTLPFGLAAGPIAAAVGIEYRREKGVTLTDPGAPDRAYALGNFSPFEGRYHVAEGFAEFDVPLLRDQGVESLSFNAAGRLTNYSTSGTVVTWKFGLTSQVNQSIRLRGTVSRDIRAPSLSDLFTAGVATTGSAIDPNTGQNVFIYTYRTGNPNLKPEKAITYSAGLVLTPSFIPRLNISVDLYDPGLVKIALNGSFC